MPAKTYEVKLTASNSDLIRKLVEAGDATEKAASKMSRSTETHTGKISGHLKSLTGKFGETAKSFVSNLGIPVVGGLAAIGAGSLEMADHFELAHARLVTAIKNSGSSFNAQKDAIDKVEASSRKLGFTDSDTEDALANMTRGMGSTQKAVGALGIAQDLARAKNISLADAATIVTKASEGQLKPLKALGIDLPVAAGGALKLQNAQNALKKAQDGLALVQSKIHQGFIKGPAAIMAYQTAQEKVKAALEKVNTVGQAGATIIDGLRSRLAGNASAAADTFAGKQKILKAELDHVSVAVGEKLEPIIEALARFLTDKLIPAISGAVTWLKNHKAIAIALGAVVATVTAGLIAYKVAVVAFEVASKLATVVTKAWSAGQWLLNAALSANPIGIVVVAIAALVAGVILAYQHFSWFRTGVEAVWTALQTAFGWITSHWPLLLAILTGPFGLAVYTIMTHWGTITSFFQSLPGKIGGWLASIPGAMFTLGQNIITGIVNGIKSMAGSIGGALTSVLKSLPGGSLVSGALSHLGLATGGVLGAGEWATVGERGPELAEGLPGGGVRIYSNADSRTMLAGRPGGGAGMYSNASIGTRGGGSTTIIVNVNGPSIGANSQYHRETALAIQNQLTLLGKR